MDAPAAANSIEVRIAEISQLFDSLDPFPFRDKDLDKEAEEFIVSWARELPVDQPLKIVVHLPQSQASTPEARELGRLLLGISIIAPEASTSISESSFVSGGEHFVIGVTVLFFSVIAGQTVAANASPHPVGRVVEESLLIFGWVANWRPIEIFLYDWWPIVRRRNLYLRLAAAHVELRPYGNDRGGKSSGE
jgi:hypothetical protein